MLSIICPRCDAKVYETTKRGIYWWEHLRECGVLQFDPLEDVDLCLCGLDTFFMSCGEYMDHIKDHDWARLLVRRELESM